MLNVHQGWITAYLILVVVALYRKMGKDNNDNPRAIAAA